MLNYLRMPCMYVNDCREYVYPQSVYIHMYTMVNRYQRGYLDQTCPTSWIQTAASCDSPVGSRTPQIVWVWSELQICFSRTLISQHVSIGVKQHLQDFPPCFECTKSMFFCQCSIQLIILSRPFTLNLPLTPSFGQ